MKPVKKTYRRKVTALVDATPSFVSVVNRGATGSPFVVVKQEDIQMNIKRRNTAPEKQAAQKSNKAVNTSQKRKYVEEVANKRETMITKFVFEKEHFASVEDVRNFMENSDFEGEMEFVDGDTVITVLNKDAEGVEFVRKDEIDTGEDGVIAEVGAYFVKAANSEDGSENDSEDASENHVAEEANDKEETEVSAKENAISVSKQSDSIAAEMPVALSKRAVFLENLRKSNTPAIRKFDHYEIWIEQNDTSFAKLLKAGMKGGAVPGFEEVMWTFTQAVRKSLNAGGDDLESQLRKDAESVVSLVLAQNALFESFVESEPEEVMKHTTPETFESLQKWATGFGMALIEDGFVAEKSAERTMPDTANNRVIAQPDIEEVVRKYITPVADSVEQLAKVVDRIAARRQISKSVPTSDLSKDEDATSFNDRKDNISKKVADEFGSVIFGR
jgi:hypothetical protein